MKERVGARRGPGEIAGRAGDRGRGARASFDGRRGREGPERRGAHRSARASALNLAPRVF